MQMVLPESLQTQLQSYLFAQGTTPCAYVHSFGCQLNVSDGERIRGVLQQIGYTLTNHYENADLILFNTCAVRGSAEDRLYGVLGNVKRYKRENPNLILVLCGCMASETHTAEFVRTHYPYVDILFGTASLSRFPKLLLEHFQGEKFAFDIGEYDDMYEGLSPSREHPFQASVPVMFGCNNFCTYCIVPYVRGRERSRKPDQIIREVRELIQHGYKEIMLLGQNVNSYGNDLDTSVTFAWLLQQIDEIPGDFVIRFLSSHPKDATPDLLDTILNEKKIGKHLHLPVQSGSDDVLRRMNRQYTTKKYLEIVDYLRSRNSDFSLTTDLIVGFPNETEIDFAGTLDLVRRVKYDNIYTFIYSKRRGTKAAEMEDKISSKEKHDRMEQLLLLQREVATEHYRRFLGRTLRVLVEGKSKRDGWLIGKDLAFIIVEFSGEESLIGTFVDVKVTKIHNWAVEGELQ
ncbi:MAG: tRNA (N6-isopentenyl adenosine(37)-C2)-methylthiotransferase MiaB [Ruminococcus sp.]|nr:tRNA (N6-isopentenyl adenosine(37)-C2)-methylthiotransferase MiaB [Ruminococcus sp.]